MPPIVFAYPSEVNALFYLNISSLFRDQTQLYLLPIPPSELYCKVFTLSLQLIMIFAPSGVVSVLHSLFSDFLSLLHLFLVSFSLGSFSEDEGAVSLLRWLLILLSFHFA